VAKFIILALLAQLMIACASFPSDYDRSVMSTFTPVPGTDNKYIFQTQTGHPYKHNSEKAEKVRHQWIKRWMEINKVCLNGYTVESRKKVQVTDDEYHVNLIYQLKCN